MFNANPDKIWYNNFTSEEKSINVSFGQYYNLSKILIKTTIQSLRLTFSDRTNQNKTIRNENEWGSMEFQPLKSTRSIEIHALETRENKQTSISEIRFYGCPGKFIFCFRIHNI